LPLEAQARQASGLRNLYKEIARDSMFDKTQAAVLDLTEPLMPFNHFVGKYVGQGFIGDDLWLKIIDASMKPNPKVNAMFGIR